MKHVKPCVIAIILSALTIVTALGLALLIKQPNVVVFDKGAAVTSLAITLNEHQVSAQKQAVVIKQFSKAMQEVLNNEAKERGFIIVSPGAVISGATNITESMLPKIAAKMQAFQQKSRGQHGKR